MKGDTGTIELTAGQKIKVLTGPANYLYAFEATGLFRVEMFKGNSRIEGHTVTRLALLPSKDFDVLEVQNIGTDAQNFRFFYGPGQYEPPNDRSVVSIEDATPVRVNVIDGQFFIDANIVPPNNFEDQADLTVSTVPVLLSVSESDKKYIYFEVPADADAPIRVGGATVTASRGLRIHPGQSVELYNSGDLYAIRTGTVDVSVSRMLSNTVVA